LSNFSTHNGPEPENDADVRSFMRQKYFEYKWLDREALYTHEKTVKEMIKSAFTDVSLVYIETFLFLSTYFLHLQRMDFQLGILKSPLLKWHLHPHPLRSLWIQPWMKSQWRWEDTVVHQKAFDPIPATRLEVSPTMSREQAKKVQDIRSILTIVMCLRRRAILMTVQIVIWRNHSLLF
jgi:hypothetical protein